MWDGATILQPSLLSTTNLILASKLKVQLPCRLLRLISSKCPLRRLKCEKGRVTKPSWKYNGWKPRWKTRSANQGLQNNDIKKQTRDSKEPQTPQFCCCTSILGNHRS